MLTANDAGGTLSRLMESVNVLEIRRSLGKVLDQLECGGGPVLVSRRRTPAAVLVSLKDYRERFLGREAADGAARCRGKIEKGLRYQPPARLSACCVPTGRDGLRCGPVGRLGDDDAPLSWGGACSPQPKRQGSQT